VRTPTGRSASATAPRSSRGSTGGRSGSCRSYARSSPPDVAPIVISGCIGPQSDGYSPTTHLEPDAARDYHAVQIATFAETDADMVTVMTDTIPALSA
jgi:S-methylmethionine-dependent homocysteine/selenocysteine methylase